MADTVVAKGATATITVGASRNSVQETAPHELPVETCERTMDHIRGVKERSLTTMPDCL